MRIGIDARLYTQTGVGRYIQNLIAELSRIDDDNEYFIYLRNEEYDSFRPVSKNWHKRLANIPWHTFREQLDFPTLILKDKLDVGHFPYFNVPIFYPGKYLLTIHDLIVDHFDTGRASTLPFPLYLIKRSGYKISLTLGIKKATAISTISETTRQEITDHYGIPKAKIKVTYDALDTKFTETLKTYKPKNRYNFPYILYVGNAYPHKNLERLAKAVSLIRKKRNVKLIFAGDDKYFYPRLRKFATDIGMENDVIFFGNANDEELIDLYTNALCLVFPSLMEGFGLPNLEVIACGRLPVVSDIAVFHEIWKDEVTYFDPKNTEDMAKNIINVIELPADQYKNKLNILQKRITDFNWRVTAKETLEIYKKIFNSH